DWVYDSQVHHLLRQGKAAEAEAMLIRRLEHPLAAKDSKHVSVLYLHDGDPGSITLDGLRALNTADALVYDQQCDVALAIIDMARRDAERYPGAISSTEALTSLLEGVLAQH